MRLNSINSPRCCQLWVIFWSKEALFYEGKYSLGNDPTIPIDCEFMMKYL